MAKITGTPSGNKIQGRGRSDKIYGYGGNDRLYGQGGNDSIVGGTGNDRLFGSRGNDTLVGSSGKDRLFGESGRDHLLGGSGNDRLLGRTGNDRLFGEGGNDLIRAGGGNDQLNGGNGNDSMRGFNGDDTFFEENGSGQDTLSGGAGNDLVVYNNHNDATPVTLNLNTETLGKTGEIDTLLLIEQVQVINSAGDTILADNLSTNLSINLFTGAISGYGGSIVSAVGFENAVGGSADDVITGNNLANSLEGGAGNDSLIGGNGNDTLIGGSGTNTLVGGAGDDTYLVSSEADILVEDADAGTDHVYTSVSLTLGSHLENMTLTGNTAISGTGNSLNNLITGNDGNNLLNGGGGNDTLVGGNGNDTYLIDDGDVIIEAENGGNDTVQASFSYTLGNHLENLTLSTGAGNLHATGNSLNNVLTGNEGHNTLDGQGGTDTMAGGLGNDTYVVDHAGDVVEETENAGTDTVQASVNYTLGTHVEHLTLTGDTNLVGSGNSLNNYVTGNSGDNTLHGLAGQDTLVGGTGNDVLAGGTEDDTYTGFSSGFGQDVIDDSAGTLDNLDLTAFLVTEVTLSSQDIDSNGLKDCLQLDFTSGDQIRILNYFGNTAATVHTSNAGSGTIESIRFKNGVTLSFTDIRNQLMVLEGLTLIGSAGNDSLTGFGGHDWIDGLGGDDTLTGAGGNDTLIGGTGQDSLIGGNGDDTYYVDSVLDVVVENPDEGDDTVYSSISYTIPANVERLILTGTDPISGTGNSGNNTITGNIGNNTLNGGGGNDTLIGADGDDTYIVDNLGVTLIETLNGGNDTVVASLNYTLGTHLENLTLSGSANLNGTGNELNNVLTGNSGNNSLNGLAGNDTMAGGLGNDTYFVDSTGDVVLEAESAGTDTVRSTLSYTLTANVEHLILQGNTAFSGAGNTLNNAITGDSGNDTLEGLSGNDTLTGNSGQDSLSGGEGNDILFGGRGEDTLLGGTGNDSLNGGLENDLLQGADGDDSLDGAGGNDLLIGDDGNDTYVYNAVAFGSDSILDTSGASDWLDFRGYANNATINLSLATVFNDGSGNTITTTLVGSLENAYGGSGSDTLTGSTVANQLHGGSGNDSVNGMGGNDTLSGGLGDDTLIGGEGDDTYLFASTTLPEFNWFASDTGNDIIDDAGNSASDVLYFYGWNVTDVESWRAVDGNDVGSLVDTLVITLNSGLTVSILNYFDNTSSDDDLSGPGIGAIESIRFNAGAGDTELSFADIQSLIP